MINIDLLSKETNNKEQYIEKILFENIAANTTVIVDYTDNEFKFVTVSSSESKFKVDNNGYIVLDTVES